MVYAPYAFETPVASLSAQVREKTRDRNSKVSFSGVSMDRPMAILALPPRIA